MAPLGFNMSFSTRKAAIAFWQLAFFLSFCSAIAVCGDDEDREEEFCTFEVGIDLTSVVFNGTGFPTESGYFFPPEKTRFKDGVRYGCVCDVKQCLNFCPLFGIKDYVNFSAIPRVYTTNLDIDDDVEALSPKQRFFTLVRNPCPEKLAFDLEPMCRKKDSFYLLRNGSLFMPLMNNLRLEFVESDEYCLQLLDDGAGYVPRICSSENYDEFYEDFAELQNFGNLVALPFFLATVIVYSVLPEFRSIHGITLRCYLCSLSVAVVGIAVQQKNEEANSPNTFCLCVGFATYFIFFASGLWLNVICFDTWLRFRRVKFFRKSSLHDDRNKIIAYSVYAWGLPAILTAIRIVMEFAPGVEELAFHPGFRMNKCRFYTIQAAALYLYGPISVTIASNICFFILTSVQLVLHNKDTQRHLNNEDSRRHNDNKQWFCLHFKLFIMMGMEITWLTEIILLLWGRSNDASYFWDLTSALHGILIFVIFVCKRDIWLSLKKRFYKLESRVADYEQPYRTREP